MEKVKDKNDEISELEEDKDIQNDEKTEIIELKDELKKTKNDYYKVLAEMENFKKRINEERIRERKYATQGLVEKLIDISDVFDQVVNVKTEDEKLKNFLTGFVMLNNSFKQLLDEEGVKEIKARDQLFDPRIHDAIETEENTDLDDNFIIAELRRGYTYKDRVLRPTLVKVNKIKKEKNNE